MRIVCNHGHFKFYEDNVGDISKFETLYASSPPLVRKGSHYEFDTQADLPQYSISGNAYAGFMAIATIEGSVGEILEANDMVFDFQKGAHALLTSVTDRVTLSNAGNYYFTTGLIQPGSFVGLKRIVSYDCYFDRSTQSFRYSEVRLV